MGEWHVRGRQGKTHPTRRPSSRVERWQGMAADQPVQEPLRVVRQSGPGHRGNARPESPGRRAGCGQEDRVACRQEDPERRRLLQTQGRSRSFLHQPRSRLPRPMRHPQCGYTHETAPAPRDPHRDGAHSRRTLHPVAGGGLPSPIRPGPVPRRHPVHWWMGLEVQAPRFPMRKTSRPRFPLHGRKKRPGPLHGLHLPGGPPRGVQ